MTPTQPDVISAIAAARDRLSRADRIFILTGAGISKASGIPTYQDLDALDETEKQWLTCDAGRFAYDPVEAWRLQEAQRQHHRRSQPNAAHRALAGWMRSRSGVTLATQNIDGLHERAALEAHHPAAVPAILRLHGSLHRGRCNDCHLGTDLPEHIQTVDGRLDLLPHCPDCGGLIRPTIIWFGEPLPQAIFRRALQAAEEADVALVIGCSLDVEPAASLPWRAQLSGAHLIEVNPQPVIDASPGFGVIRIAAPAEQVVPLLVESIPGDATGTDPAADGPAGAP